MRIIPISGHQRKKIGWMSAYRRVSERVLIIFYWVPKSSKFPADKWRFDNTDPHSSVAPSKRNVFLLIYCKLKTNFIAKSQLLYMGCPLTKERKQKKNPIFIFKTVRVRLRESIRLWECENTESDWDCKTGI